MKRCIPVTSKNNKTTYRKFLWGPPSLLSRGYWGLLFRF